MAEIIIGTYLTELDDSGAMAKVGGQPWYRMRLRKPTGFRCFFCMDWMKAGVEAFKPLVEGNGVVRNMRAHATCVEEAALKCRVRAKAAKTEVPNGI